MTVEVKNELCPVAVDEKTVIPAHYDLFYINQEDPLVFKKAFEKSPIRCEIPELCKEYNIASLITS
jgi:L-ascorbate metabolism protein UlaG (beta-lactamase superfamily)